MTFGDMLRLLWTDFDYAVPNYAMEAACTSQLQLYGTRPCSNIDKWVDVVPITWLGSWSGVRLEDGRWPVLDEVAGPLDLKKHPHHVVGVADSKVEESLLACMQSRPEKCSVIAGVSTTLVELDLLLKQD